MKKCRVCSVPLSSFMSFGQMPLANGFLTPDQFADEYFFELSVGSCPHCGMFQLMEQPNRETMFNARYPFYSSSSREMAVHFRKFADHVKKDYLFSNDPFVVEIGSNDGTMLQNFADADIRHLGIEPSLNVAQAAISRGINTINAFFDEDSAREIVKKYGPADAFLAANVMCHIPYLHSVIKGIEILLKPKGVVMFEDPYLGDVIENTSYDQIYDEHVFLFSLSSISYLFGQHEMEIIDIEPQETHGGSMRYIVARKGMYPVSDRVNLQVKKEKHMGLEKPETYESFRKDCEHSRENLMALLRDLSRQGKKIVGYAATSKSTTIINYCGISTDLIEYISDTTPIKQGTFSPGAHIPVRPYEEFLNNYPDYALLFAYNHAKEIISKEKKFVEAGGKWIVYVPETKVL
jgi:methylation protein EvaC